MGRDTSGGMPVQLGNASTPPELTRPRARRRSAHRTGLYQRKEMLMSAADLSPTPTQRGIVTSLDDKYSASGRVFMTGYQALVRLLLIQAARDRAAGLNTAGFVSGYRGSPLGALDQSLWKARDHEVVIAGPYETGKTIAALHKLNALLCKYPRARALMVRKTYKSLLQSACVTLETKVFAYPPGHPR